MTKRSANLNFKLAPRTLLLALTAAFVASTAGWIYNVHQWLVEPTAVYNIAGPQENNYWAMAQFDIAAIRLENSILRVALQSQPDVTPASIQYQIVLSKLALLSQRSEATATAMDVKNYRDAVAKLQREFNDVGPMIDQLYDHPKVAVEVAKRVHNTEQMANDLAEAIGEAEVKHRDLQLRAFQKNRRTFYATTAAVFLTVMTALAVLVALLRQRRAAVLAKESAVQAANDAVKAKNAFLGIIGHELRTPLQTITSAIDTLSDRPHSARDMKIIFRLEQATQQLIAQMHDLTDYSRLESGKLTTQNSTFDAVDLLSCVVEDATPQAKQKGLSLRFESTLGRESSFTDPSRVRQIVTNLINNAIKYSDHGEVVVRLSLTRTNVAEIGSHLIRIEVEDQGTGIPAEKIKTMFEPFTQLDQSHTRRHEGIGMGLAIVKRLVDLLHGEINVESETGRGSCFTVVLPSLLPAIPQPNQIRPEPPSTVWQACRILVVDDQEAIRESFARLLESMKIKFDVSPDADDALRLLSFIPYDALLLDIQMPGKDGFAVIQALRQNPGPNSQIPIIGVSAFAPEMLDQTKANMFVDYLMKPVRGEALRVALAHAMRHHKDETVERRLS